MSTTLQVFSNTEVLTMTSLEIVGIINSVRKEEFGQDARELRHADFLNKVAKVLEGGERNFSSSYLSSQNKELLMYKFPKREATLMVMSESYKVQAAVYDRLQELEDQIKSSQIALPNFNDPVLAARAWADAVESKNKAVALTYQQSALILEQEDEIKIMKPTVQWVETYVESKAMLYKFRQVTQLLGAKERDFRAWLVACKIMYKLSGYWTCYAEHRDAGMFETYVDKHNTYKTETYFTAKGFEWISKKWDKHVSSQSI